MPPVVITLTGKTLTIRSVKRRGSGLFGVTVSAQRWDERVQQSFLVNEVQSESSNNRPPVLTAPANQTMSHAKHSLALTLSATDPDDNSLTYKRLRCCRRAGSCTPR